MDLNKAMIIGNVTRDPESRTTPQGTSVASFAVATNLVWTDASGQRQEKAEFHNIVAWRKLAEICGQYLKKGSKVFIEGRIQTRDWTGQDGVKRYMTEIIAENMIMLDRAGQGGGQSFQASQQKPREDSFSQADSPAPADQPDQPEQSEQKKSGGSDDEIKLEDIPF